MRFTKFALALTSVLNCASRVVCADSEGAQAALAAAQAAEAAAAEEGSQAALAAAQAAQDAQAAQAGFEATKEKPFDFRVEYYFNDKQEGPSTEVVPVTNGEALTITYIFADFEEEAVSIVGVGGKLLDPASGETVANVTASQLGPLSIEAGTNNTFAQKLKVNVPTETLLFVPAIYIVYQEKFMMLGAKNQLIEVSDPEISFFNPKLILSEIALLATLAAVVYVIYQTGGKKYFDKILPQQAKKAATRAAEAQAVSSGSSADWLPETHKRTAKKRVSKKQN